MLYILKRVAHALKPRMAEGFVVWKISTLEPEHDLAMSYVDFAWPWTSEQDMLDRVQRESKRGENVIVTATRQDPTLRMFVWKLPLMYSGPLFYNLNNGTGQGWGKRNAIFMNNVNYELSALSSHWYMNKTTDAKLLPFKQQISWHLTHLMGYIEPSEIEWSENPFAWPHACDQAGCGMHKDKPYCSYQSKWCKLAQKVRPDIERKLAKGRK